MYQLRLKLELINSTASVDVKINELRRKTKLSFLIGIFVVLFYAGGVVGGVVLETKRKQTNGVLTQCIKTFTLIILTSAYFYVMNGLRKEMAKFDQSVLKRELKLVKRQQLFLCLVSALQTISCFGVTVYLYLKRHDDCQ